MWAWAPACSRKDPIMSQPTTVQRVTFPEKERPEVKAPPVTLRVVDATYTPEGMEATIEAHNGRLLLSRQVRLDDAGDRRAYSSEVHAAGGVQIQERTL